MTSADEYFRRNFQFARSINYDLYKVHSDDVCRMIQTSADSLLLDEQMLSLTLRCTAAFHLDTAKLRIDNDANREKHIVDYTLIITSIGSGKSTIFNKLSQSTTKRDEYEKRRKMLQSSGDGLTPSVINQTKAHKNGIGIKKDESLRHIITNDFTGAGIFKSLSDCGNVLVLIDEFDGEYQKSNIFITDTKTSGNALTSANGLLKTMHTGVDSYRKTRADGYVTLTKPHITFLGASNGNVVIDILRQKLKTINVPDAMVERFAWEALMASTKLNATRLVNVPPKSIGLELYFLASSLLTNHTLVFNMEANTKICSWMDELALARARWDQIDVWLSGRLAKSIDQTARIAAQLNHIELTMKLLKDFVSIHEFNTFGSITFEIYYELADFIEKRYPPSSSTVVEITDKAVDCAIYSMTVVMIKYLNLFNTDPTITNAIVELPMHPPPKFETSGNPSMSNLPTTQQTILVQSQSKKDEFVDLQKTIMKYPSIAFTRTMLYNISKLKSRKHMLTPLLQSLVEIGLLKEFENGIITGLRRSNLFIKILPAAETLNTTNQFTLDLLDQINLPWLLYRPTCTSLILPSKTSTLSSEVNQYFKNGIYQKILGYPAMDGTGSDPLIESSHSPVIIDGSSIIQSTDLDVISPTTTVDVALPSSRLINVNMPQPPSSSSRALLSLPISSYSNEHADYVKDPEDDNSTNEHKSLSTKQKTLDVYEFDHENEYSSNVLLAKRQSARIQSSKRNNPTSSMNLSERKKKKKTK